MLSFIAILVYYFHKSFFNLIILRSYRKDNAQPVVVHFNPTFNLFALWVNWFKSISVLFSMMAQNSSNQIPLLQDASNRNLSSRSSKLWIEFLSPLRRSNICWFITSISQKQARKRFKNRGKQRISDSRNCRKWNGLMNAWSVCPSCPPCWRFLTS